MSENVPIPLAPKRPHEWHRPSGVVSDPYAWMRDHDDPELAVYLRDENRYADAWFEDHDDLVESLYDEIRGRIQEDDLSVPVYSGGWWYVAATAEGANYARHHRGPTADRATDHLLLDENVEAAGTEYFDLGAFDASIDHRLLAWSCDVNGDERYRLRVRDLDTGEDAADVIDGVANTGTAWSRDGDHLFYVTADEQERPCTVWRHRMGTPAAEDVIVFDEPDESYYVSVFTTRSDRWIVIHSASLDSSEARLLPTDDPTATPHPVLGRRVGVEYTVDDWGDRLVMLTNDNAIDFRVLAADAAADHSDPATWTELVPGVAGRRIVAADPFAEHLVLVEWAEAQPRLRILFRDGTERTIVGPDEPHDIDLAANPDWHTAQVRFVSQSMTTPATVYEEPATGGERRLLKRLPTPNVDRGRLRRRTDVGGGRRRHTACRSISCVTSTRRSTAALPASSTAYGAYEVSIPPRFSAARLSLLDRGVVFALVHPRGGGELGRRWYLDGKLDAKRNTFTDTLAAVDHLVDAGAGSTPRGARSAAGQPAGCSWVRARRCAHSASGWRSPRCRSSTSSTR